MKYKVGDLVRIRETKKIGVITLLIPYSKEHDVFDYEVLICGEEDEINAFWEDEIEKLKEETNEI